MADIGKFLKDEADGFFEVGSVEASGDVKGTGIGEGDDGALDAVAEAVAFAKFLEEAGAHIFAEDDGEELEGEAAFVGAPEGAEADGEMSLFGVLGIEANEGLILFGVAADEAWGLASGESGEERGEELDGVFVGDGTGDGDDGASADVVAFVEAKELFAVEIADGFDRPSERPSEGMIRPHRFGEELLNSLGVLVAIHEDFLADDFAFAFDFCGGELALLEHIVEDIAEVGEMGSGGFGVVAGMILGGESVEVASDAFDGFGDFFGGSAFSSFEEEVFDEVSDSAFASGFVATTDGRPEADADAFHVGHFDRGNARAVGEFGETIGIIHEG